MAQAPPSVVSSRLAAAMAHPLRVRALSVLFNRIASPGEIARELEEPVNNVTYHVKRLVELGCAELVSTRAAQGGRVVEHFYRATDGGYLDDEAWKPLGDEEKQNLTMTIMRVISEDINLAMAKGTFYEDDDNHLSRTPFMVDTEGWQEIKETLSDALQRLLTIRENIAARAASGDQETFPARVNILHYRFPKTAGSET